MNIVHQQQYKMVELYECKMVELCVSTMWRLKIYEHIKCIVSPWYVIIHKWCSEGNKKQILKRIQWTKRMSILLSYAVGVDRLTRSTICFVDSTEIMSWPASNKENVGNFGRAIHDKLMFFPVQKCNFSILPNRNIFSSPIWSSET